MSDKEIDREFQPKVTGNDVLEIEYIIGGHQILVKRDGQVAVTKLKADAKPFEEQLMPSLYFWHLLHGLVKSMADEISGLKVKLAIHEEGQVTITENKKKFIPVGANRKEMFAAGVVFGKSMRK